MNAPAQTANQSPLESALREVHATLTDLLDAADEQYAAVAAHDRDRIERVSRQQERLSSRLARAEAQRLEIQSGAPLAEAVATLPPPHAARVEGLRQTIGAAVRELKLKQSRSAELLEHSIELGAQTLTFLQRLVAAPSPAYSPSGVSRPRHS